MAARGRRYRRWVRLDRFGRVAAQRVSSQRLGPPWVRVAAQDQHRLLPDARGVLVHPKTGRVVAVPVIRLGVAPTTFAADGRRAAVIVVRDVPGGVDRVRLKVNDAEVWVRPGVPAALPAPTTPATWTVTLADGRFDARVREHLVTATAPEER